ncbi:MAG: hypothetical protein FJZ96_04650 [Chloroflexi bacterium]|nr:hypothetical protein [Chloroflexota bacterium]
MSKKEKRKVSKGTGKRYTSTKPRPQAEPARSVRPPERTYAEKVLRKRIPEFAFRGERFRADFEKAMELYSGQKPGVHEPLSLDENELPAFQEWYFFDYVTLSGKRIIDLFLEEVGPRLNSEQRAMLEDWLVWNRARLLEFQEIKPGIGVVVQDLLSDEVFEVNDISASHTATRWTFGLLRPIRTAGWVSFTGSALLLPPMEKEGVLKAARNLWNKYRAKNPKAGIPDFYRENSLLLLQFCRKAHERTSRPPIALSAEGHALVLAHARYRLCGDSRQVEAMLDDTKEFICTGDSEEHRGALHYYWILRGRSHVPQAKGKPEEYAVLLRTEWTEGPGRPSFLNLGDLILAKEWLELECLSRERLKVGKALLESTLGGLISHQGDRYEDMESALDANDPKPARNRTKISSKDARAFEELEEGMLHRLTRDWLDQPFIAGKLTPRQAVRTPEGRRKVIEILKQIEYNNELRLQSGEGPTMDADYIRTELGLGQ